MSIFPFLKAETIFREFNTREPFVVDNPSNYTYITSYGNYSFDKTTGAYQYVYRNGSILAPSVKFIVQHLENQSWEDFSLSAPTFIEVKKEHLQFRQTIYDGTVPLQYIIVDALFYEESPPKLSIVYDNPSWINMTFRILFKVTIPQAWTYFLHQKNDEVLTIPQSESISFRTNKIRVLEIPDSILKLLVDWSDFGSTTVVLKGSTVTVIFPEDVKDIDPTTIGESMNVGSTRETSQRKIVYETNVKVFIAFYDNGSAFVYSTSVNGSQWTDPISVTESGDYGFDFSVWFDGTYIHYAVRDVWSLKYRRGSLQPDKSFNWSDNEQTVLEDVGMTLLYPYVYISTDSDGYPFITYPNITLGKKQPCIVKSEWNNGSWSTDTEKGFPHPLSNQLSLNMFYAQIVPLSSNKMYAVYNLANGDLNGTLWNGTIWGAHEKIDLGYGWFSVVANGDDVHLVYAEYPDQTTAYRKRTFESGWSTKEVFLSKQVIPTLTIDKSSGIVYCFWLWIHAYYKARLDNEWTGTTLWIETTNVDGLTSMYQKQNDCLAVIWNYGSTSPYSIVFHQFIYSALVPPFTIYNIGNNFPIVNPSWSDTQGKLVFYTSGNVTINLGTFNQNPLSITDNDKSIAWTKTDSNITLTNLKGAKIVVTFESDITSSSSSPSEGKGDGITIPISPPFSIDKIGLITIIGGVGLFTLSALLKRKPSGPTKPPGIQSRRRPPRRVPSPPKRRVKTPRKPRRDKRTGRFIKT